jgi:hypothetical protein
MMGSKTARGNGPSRSAAGLGCLWGLVLALSVAAPARAAETVVPEWLRQFGTAAFDEAQSVSVLDGAVFVAGRTLGDFPERPPEGEFLETFLRRYDADGNAAWTVQYEGRTAPGLAAHGSGVYVAGRVQSETYVHKFDLDGNHVWETRFGHAFANTGEKYAVHVDAGGVYVAGYQDGPMDGQPSFGGTDAFVTRMDHDGNTVWMRQFGTDGNDFAGDLAVFGGRVYVVGETTGEFPGQTSQGGGADTFLRAYDLDGNEQWTRQFGFSFYDLGNAVHADASGIYVGADNVGNAGRTFPCGCFAYLRKYDADGGLLWEKRIPVEGQIGDAVGLDVPSIHGITADDSGLYLLGDGYRGIHLNIWARKYSRNGNSIWTEKFGNDDDEENAAGIAVAAGGDLYAAGGADGDFLGGMNLGFSDAYLLKLTPDSDADGLSDKEDACPQEAPALGLDADGDGCTDTLDVLIGMVQALDPQPKGLLAKLEDARKALEADRTRVAINKLRDFIRQAEAQRGKTLTDEEADRLVAYAANLVLLLEAAP